MAESRATDRDTGRETRPGRLLTALALVAAAIHLAQTATYALPSGQFKNLHVGLSLIVVFLVLAQRAAGAGRRIALLVAAAASVLPLAWIHLEYPALVSERMFAPSTLDTAVAILLVALVLGAVALQWGITIPLIALAALTYAHAGPVLPGELLFHGGIEFKRLLAYASIPYFQGVLGSLTSLSANVVFVFMLFAGMLKATGGIDFIMTLSRAVGRNTRGGPAQVAVFSSGFMGMISGSTVANVASTGAMTIPMMQRFGFRPAHAAAIEAVASTGGQFAPPVMGLTAFLIVGMTGIPYNQVMLSAVLPALVYYGYLVAAINVQARIDAGRIDAGAAPGEDADALSLRAACRSYWHLLGAITLLVWLLVAQMPPALAAAWALALMATTETARRMVAGRDRPFAALVRSAKVLARGLTEGVRTGAQLAIVIAAIGIFVDVLVTTGFAQKLSWLILDVAAEQRWLILVMTAIACLIFGLGLPTPAAYILVALLGVPALERVGVPTLAAHLFVFYYANLSALTPPVAIAALVAARIADAGYFRTAFAACRLGLAGFVLPFLFVAAPAILLLGDDDLGAALAVFASALLGLVALNCVIVGYALAPLSIGGRVLAGAAAAGLLSLEPWPATAGAALFLGLAGVQQLGQNSATSSRRNE